MNLIHIKEYENGFREKFVCGKWSKVFFFDYITRIREKFKLNLRNFICKQKFQNFNIFWQSLVKKSTQTRVGVQAFQNYKLKHHEKTTKPTTF